MTLTKADIVNTIHDEFDYTRQTCVDIVGSLLEIMKETMESGEDVLISGFGKFCVNEKRKRRGRNPATGKSMMLPKRRVVTFRCSNVLREMVNE